MLTLNGKRRALTLTFSKSVTQPREYHQNRGFFGRRIGRPLNKARAQMIKARLPDLSIDLDSRPLPSDKPTWMEIGFGDGAHLEALMRTHPDIHFIGIEPYINGMGNFLNRIEDIAEPNVQVHMDDAIPLLHKLPDACLERLYVLNPDPWPKTRHHKRRIINQEHLSLFSRLLKPGAWLVMATDVDDLVEWMVTECSNHPDFEWTAQSAADWQDAPEWWALTTRYAQKGLEAGRTERYLIFEKI